MEDSGAVVESQPLVPKAPGLNPVMSGFCLWDVSTKAARILVKSSSLFRNRCKINKFKLTNIYPDTLRISRNYDPTTLGSI